MLFNFPHFIINGQLMRNFYINHMYALSHRIKHVRNKVWSEANGSDYEQRHEIWLQNNVYCS